MKSVLISPARYLGCVPVCVCVVWFADVTIIKDKRTQSTTECNIISNTSNDVTIECLCHGLDGLVACLSPRHEFRNHRIVVYLFRVRCVWNCIVCFVVESRTEISEPSKIPESTRTTSDSVRHFVGS